jgi:hypothetical protein
LGGGRAVLACGHAGTRVGGLAGAERFGRGLRPGDVVALYGTFGNDFLWPPHVLMYSAFALIVAIVGGLMFTNVADWLRQGSLVSLGEPKR